MSIKFFKKLAFTPSIINWAGQINKYSWQITYFENSPWFEYENYISICGNQQWRVFNFTLFKILFGLEWEK